MKKVRTCFCCAVKNEPKPPAPAPSPTPAPVEANAKSKEAPENKTDQDANTVDGQNIAAQTFNFRELATATKNFRQECLLGEGGFGRVYKGTLQSNGQVNYNDFLFLFSNTKLINVHIYLDHLILLEHACTI